MFYNLLKNKIFITICAIFVTSGIFFAIFYVKKTDLQNNSNTNSEYGSDHGSDDLSVYSNPMCSVGYSRKNVCKTGRPDDFCRIGETKNLKFTSVQGKENNWTWTCEENRQAESCAVQDVSQCVLFSVEGYGYDGKFTNSIKKLIEPYSCKEGYKNIVVERIGSADNDISAIAMLTDKKLAEYYRNNDLNEKILVAGHSAGAVASFLTEKISSVAFDTEYLYYDPPYNASGISWSRLAPGFFVSILGIFSSTLETNIKNAELILYAKKHGLTGQNPKVIDWTNGYDGVNEPGRPNDEYLHSIFLHEEGHLNRITNWIEVNCRQ